jgi:flagellar hook-basal body complex protein FliE
MAVAPLGNPVAPPAISNGNGLPSLIPGMSALPSAADFGQMISDYMRQASDMQAQVGAEVERLASGESDNIQDVILSAAQADLAVRMVIELRNRLMSTYQEVMRMQI